MALTGTALALVGISLSFGGIRALRDVSFHVRPGEIRAVIGPKGAGKSSVLNVISGQCRADAGCITMNGKIFDFVPVQDLAALGVARAFQTPAVSGSMTVAAAIAQGLTPHRKTGRLSQVLRLPGPRGEAAEMAERVVLVAQTLDLTAHLEKKVAALPHGLQKRVALARALVAEPRLLLLDEPMAGLTASGKAEMAGYIRAACDTVGLAVILTERDIGPVMSLVDQVAVLDRGRKIADGAPAEVQRDPQVIRVCQGPKDEGDSSGVAA
jgi:branched-chain amino acid transport system ATP-binding protein